MELAEWNSSKQDERDDKKRVAKEAGDPKCNVPLRVAHEANVREAPGRLVTLPERVSP